MRHTPFTQTLAAPQKLSTQTAASRIEIDAGAEIDTKAEVATRAVDLNAATIATLEAETDQGHAAISVAKKNADRGSTQR